MTASTLGIKPWHEQTMIWTERMRGRPLLWPPDAPWFVNDPLGPMPHTHEGASEVVYVAAGSMELIVGRTTLVLETGDYCLIPPDTFHEPRNIGADDLRLFVLVVPNLRDRRWKPEGFVESDYIGTCAVVRAKPGPLPSDDLIDAAVIEWPAATTGEVERQDGQERVIYVLSGSAAVEVDSMRGDFGQDEYATVPGGAVHRVSTGARSATFMSLWTGSGS